jgi:hypothetical protein
MIAKFEKIGPIVLKALRIPTALPAADSPGNGLARKERPKQARERALRKFRVISQQVPRAKDAVDCTFCRVTSADVFCYPGCVSETLVQAVARSVITPGGCDLAIYLSISFCTRAQSIANIVALPNVVFIA